MNPPLKKQDVWIVEDDIAYREAVASILNASDVFFCGLQFDSAIQLTSKLVQEKERRPSVILLDVGLPGRSGIDAMPDIQRMAPEIPIVILTVFEDDEKIFRSICQGAVGYLLKADSPEKIIPALMEAMDGGSPLTPKVAKRVIEMFARHQQPDLRNELTPMESKVLELLSKGLLYKEIAEALGLSLSGANYHVDALYKKIHVHSRTEAVSRALRNGWI